MFGNEVEIGCRRVLIRCQILINTFETFDLKSRSMVFNSKTIFAEYFSSELNETINSLILVIDIVEPQLRNVFKRLVFNVCLINLSILLIVRVLL